MIEPEFGNKREADGKLPSASQVGRQRCQTHANGAMLELDIETPRWVKGNIAKLPNASILEAIQGWVNPMKSQMPNLPSPPCNILAPKNLHVQL